MRTLLLCLLALLPLQFPLRAQSWEALRELSPNDRIKVEITSGPGYLGIFQSVSADAISLDTGHGAVSVERTRVRRIQVRSTGRRIRRVVIASAVGLAIGITIDQSLGTLFRNESGETSGARAATYIAPSAVFGAIAAAFPAYRTLYRVR